MYTASIGIDSMHDSFIPGELEENLESYTGLNWDF